MKTIRLIIILCCMGCCGCLTATAQNANTKQIRKLMRTGNRHFHNGDRDEATTAYKKTLELDSTNVKALYNLATSMLPEQYWRPWPQLKEEERNKQIHDVDSLYQKVIDREQDPLKKSKSFYNLGVMYQTLYQSNGKDEQNLNMAIEAYKNALRNNPTDNEARYNLAVCQKQLKKKQHNQPQNNQDNKDKQQNDSTKNQQQQQNDSTQNQQQQQPPQQNKPQDQQENQQQQNQQEQNQQPPQGSNQQQSMEQQRMEQMMQKALQKERDTQKRMNDAQQMMQRNRRSNRKNW